MVIEKRKREREWKRGGSESKKMQIECEAHNVKKKERKENMDGKKGSQKTIEMKCETGERNTKQKNGEWKVGE